MLSIGEFSKLGGVSTKALRYYDEIGLLKPEEINPENGYRLYSRGQLQTVLFINRLKAFQFSLEEIRTLLLDDPTGERLGAALRAKQREIGRLVDDYTHIGQQIQDDLRRIERGISIMAYIDQIEVALVETEPVELMAMREVIDLTEFPAFIGRLFEAVGRAHLTPVGAPRAYYHNVEHRPEACDTEIAVPVARAVAGQTRSVPAMTCARAVLRSGYDGLMPVYARLQTWIEQEGYVLDGAPYEVYTTDPHEVARPEDNITEVYCPVRKA